MNPAFKGLNGISVAKRPMAPRPCLLHPASSFIAAQGERLPQAPVNPALLCSPRGPTRRDCRRYQSSCLLWAKPGQREHTLSGGDHQLVREDKGPRRAPRRRGTLSCGEAWVGGSSDGVQAAVDFLPGEGLFFPLITSLSCPPATHLPDTPSRSVPSDRNTV